MDQYFQNLNGPIKHYFHILSDEIPDFLKNYVNTPAIQRLAGISRSCGTFYSNMYQQDWYSTLRSSGHEKRL